MLTVPRNAAEILTLQAVLVTGSLIGGVACGVAGAGIWNMVNQPWYNGSLLWSGFGMALGYAGTLMVLDANAQPRRIPNLNTMEVTRVTAVVPDRTEGTIGHFPLPPGELRHLACELLVPGVRFTQARFKGKYGMRSYITIRDEMLKRQWAIPTYQNSIELTVAGRHVMMWLASPTPRHKM